MEICSVYDCTACGACAEICPTKCIKMVEDENGFQYPKIDTIQCVNCKACVKICPNNDINKIKINDNFTCPTVLAYVNPDKKTLKKSSSGGVFSSIAEWIVNNGGTVYGAVFSEKFDSVKILRGTEFADIEKMRGSKYVECSTEKTYSEVKKDLNDDKYVLYTGSPCHIAGLYAVLKGTNCDKLYTVEILCNGVPSSKLYKMYMKYIEKKYGEIKNYSFRDKDKWGWGSWGSFSYKKNNTQKTKYFVSKSDYYSALYFSSNCFRESCYKCRYSKLPRIADITIGDFWGIEQFKEYSYFKEGVSIVLLNNEHGSELSEISGISADSNMYKLGEVKSLNSTITAGVLRPKDRDTFYKDLNELGFENVARKYVKLNPIKSILIRYIPFDVKQKIKKYLHR